MKLTLEQMYERIAGGHFYIPRLSITNEEGEQINVLSFDITFDEEGEDFIVAHLATPPGLEIDVLAAPIFHVSAALIFPNTQEESETVLDAFLVARRSETTAEITKITLQSYESRIRDAGADSNRAYTSADDTTSVLTQIITSTLPGQVVESDIVQPLSFLTADEVLQWKTYPNPWGIIQEIADNVEATVFHDGKRFRITKPAVSPSTSKFIAPLEFVLDTSLVHDRDTFANSVITRHQGTVEVRADLLDGAHSVAKIGRKVYIDEIPHQISTAQARRRAQALLSRKKSAGSTFTAKLTILPLGLFPGDTLTVYTREDSWKGVLAAITYDLINGTTLLTLRNIERN